MSQGFDVTPGRLEEGARGFGTVADDLRRAIGELRAALGAIGDPCGGDEQGRAFAAAYLPRVDEGLRSLDGLAGALGTVPGALRGAAGSYGDGDAAAGADLGGTP